MTEPLDKKIDDQSLDAAEHAVLDHSGIPGTAGKPAVSDWQQNTETLAANKTLTDSSETLQFLDPDGTTRLADLPAVGAANPFFYIFNTGRQGARVHVMNGDLTLVSLRNGEGARFFSNGTLWTGFKLDTISSRVSTGQVLSWGGDLTTVNKLPNANAKPSQLALASLGNFATEQYVLANGDVVGFGWSSASTPSGTMRLYVDGADSGVTFTTWGATQGFELLSSPLAVTQGERLSLRWETSGGYPGHSLWWLYLSNGGMSFPFGGDLNLAGNFPVVNGRFDDPDATSGWETEIIVPNPGLVTRVGFNRSNTGSMTLQLWKNGALFETVVGSGSRGHLDFNSAAFVETGDDLAIKNSAGAAGQAIFQLGLSAPGTIYSWAANPGVADRFFLAMGLHGDAGLAASSDDTICIVTRGGAIRKIMWVGDTGTTIGPVEIRVNQQTRATVTLSTGTAQLGSGVLDIVPLIDVVPGDELEVFYPTGGTLPGETSIQLLVR